VFSELLKHPRAIALSVGFHVVVIAIILINFHFSDSTNLVKQAELAKTVKAEIVDQQQLEAQKTGRKKNRKPGVNESSKNRTRKKQRKRARQKRNVSGQKRKNIR
jgi:membrane protein involved in colicin uptake